MPESMKPSTSPYPSPNVWATQQDGQLMVAVAQGDREAFTELVTRHLTPVVHFAMRYVGRRPDAEDVAQEAFIRLWKHAAEWEEKGFSIRSWIYRITYNLCIDELRKRKPLTPVEDEVILASTEQPDEDVYQDQRQRQVAAALKELPERQRTALVLCVYQGLSNQNAATVMDISVEALESLLSRARRMLRNKMTETQ
jgi:RNA polymerase sigma-70 factor (ECF subfamily)